MYQKIRLHIDSYRWPDQYTVMWPNILIPDQFCGLTLLNSSRFAFDGKPPKWYLQAPTLRKWQASLGNIDQIANEISWCAGHLW